MTSQRRQLKQLNISDVNSDLVPNETPENVYNDVLNMEVTDIGMRSSLGNVRAFGAPLFPPEHLAYNKTADQFFWIYASSTGIGVTDGVAHFDLTPVIPGTSVCPRIGPTRS